MPSIPCNFSPSFAKINRLCAYPMQSRFYCPSFAYCRFSLRDAGRGRPFRFLPQAGACTPLGNNLSPVCGQCRRRFRFTAAVPLSPGCRKGPPPLPLSSAGGACTPLGNNLSPVCGQCRQRFRFIAAVPLPPGMPEGAAAPSALFRRRGRVPRRGAIFCSSGRNDLLSSSISSVPKTSAEGKSLPIHKTRCTA